MIYLGFHCNRHLSDVQKYAEYSRQVRNVSAALAAIALLSRLFPVAVGLGAGSLLGHVSYCFFSHVEKKLNDIIEGLAARIPNSSNGSLFL